MLGKNRAATGQITQYIQVGRFTRLLSSLIESVYEVEPGQGLGEDQDTAKKLLAHHGRAAVPPTATLGAPRGCRTTLRLPGR